MKVKKQPNKDGSSKTKLAVLQVLFFSFSPAPAITIQIYGLQVLKLLPRNKLYYIFLYMVDELCVLSGIWRCISRLIWRSNKQGG
jgi:hypothetical protein